MYLHDLYDCQGDNLHDISSDIDVKKHFIFLRYSTITSFFASNMVDMPMCFKKSKSLYSKTFELPLLKFINIIMRHGLREQALKAVTLSFNRCFLTTSSRWADSEFDWSFIYHFFLQTNFTTSTQTSSYWNRETLYLDRLHKLSNNDYQFNSQVRLKNTLFDSLEAFTPIFSFYIKKVSKTLRKNSRGKSGKYMLIWKYVPVYKRLFVTMRWFLKGLRFQKSRGFHERLHKIIEDFLLTPDLTFVSKVRRFTHKFVFAQHRQTLLKTLKSV